MEMDRPSNVMQLCVWFKINMYLRMSCLTTKSYCDIGLFDIQKCTYGTNLVLQESRNEIFAALKYSLEKYVPWIVATIWFNLSFSLAYGGTACVLIRVLTCICLMFLIHQVSSEDLHCAGMQALSPVDKVCLPVYMHDKIEETFDLVVCKTLLLS